MSYERSDVDPLGGAVSVRAVRCVCVCAGGTGTVYGTPRVRCSSRVARTFRPRGGAGGWLGPRGGALVRSQPGRGSCRRRRGCIGHRIVEPGAPPPRPDAASSVTRPRHAADPDRARRRVPGECPCARVRVHRIRSS